MSYKLYHYVHCPFCVRVRLALGYFNLPYESIVLAYDDEATPLKLTGIKMLPILVAENRTINESLDIMALLDLQQQLCIPELTKTAEFKSFEAYLNQIGGPIHSLAMPQWIYTQEFTPESRQYFQQKKEAKRGPFKDLINKKEDFINILNLELSKLEKELTPFYKSSKFSLYDIMLAAHLWGMYMVPEFQFSPAIHSYLQNIKAICRFDYHRDFWG
jgi:glutaredoxin 2